MAYAYLLEISRNYRNLRKGEKGMNNFMKLWFVVSMWICLIPMSIFRNVKGDLTTMFLIAINFIFFDFFVGSENWKEKKVRKR